MKDEKTPDEKNARRKNAPTFTTMSSFNVVTLTHSLFFVNN
jgi:hypothetical protein